MKIGFDGKRAAQNFTGLGNYSRYLVEILCAFYPENRYVLYCPKPRSNKMLDRLQAQYKELKVTYPSGTLWQTFSSLWRIWGITKQLEQEEIELFHGLSNELPLNMGRSNIKSIVTIHDLIFLRYPQYYAFVDRKIYAYKFRKACQHAHRIIAISECTKQDIIRLFHIPQEKISVVYQGCDPAFAQPATPAKKQEVRAKHHLPSRYVLSVGSIEERKNALLLVQALGSLAADVHLVLIGRRTAYTQQVEQYMHTNGLADRVHILHGIPFDDLPAIYQQCEVFAYPSRFEGFGIPIVEALHSGVPVVAATGSCLEEAGGPHSVYVDPDDAVALASALARILSHPAVREAMVSNGRAYVERFSKEEQAKSLMKIYREVLDIT